MSAEHPPEIIKLLRQQEEIRLKLERWRKQQEEKKIKEQEKVELDNFIGVLGKRRTFNGIKYNLPQPKRLKRCFHNIKVIQKKEEELAKERTNIKEECIRDIRNYLEDLEEI